jgi:hypothetical protein
MDALRIYQKPEKGILTIKLPERLAKSQELEIIILPKESKYSTPDLPFNASNYFGLWRDKDLDADKISREMRDEWLDRS